MTIFELRDQLNRDYAEFPAQVGDIPRQFRRGSPPMYYNNHSPLAWDATRILVSQREESYWRYAIYGN